MPTVWKRYLTTWRKPGAGRVRSLVKVCLGIDILEDRLAPAVDVLTFHNDTQSWGVNSGETVLTPSNVNTSTFGKQSVVPLDGEVYAQPLVATNITIANGPNTSVGATGIHDVVFVATEHDSVYAIDTTTGAILWQRSFIDTTASYIGSALGTNINNPLGATGANGEAIRTVPWYDTYSDNILEIGITGTPVIDRATNSMFVNVQTKQILAGGLGWVQQLHAISLSDGTDTLNPYTLGINQGDNNNTTEIYTYGTGDGSVDGIVKFNALRELHRCALSLVNGQVYLQWASHGDVGPYHGFVARLGFDATDFKLTGVINVSPNNGLAGIWMSGGKLTFEPDGSAFYFETGNGSGGAPTLDAQGFPTNANYNEAVVKVVDDPTTTAENENSNGWGMKISDYFIPNNVVALDNADSDFGSGAPIILPDSAGIPGAPHLMLAAGKEGTIFVLNRDNLGKFNASANQVVSQTGPNTVGGATSTPLYFNGKVYWLSGYYGGLFQYAMDPTTGAISALAVTPEPNLGILTGSPSISANGILNGIVWVTDRTGNLLHAYDASSVATELWASNQAVGGGDNLDGAVVKFAPPTVANGHVFVATSAALNVFGLKQNANAVPDAPVLIATALSGQSINLTWTDSTTAPNTATSYSIEESADGGATYTLVTTSPAGAISIAIGGLTPQTTYSFRIRGKNSFGTSNYSNVATATTTSAITGINYGGGFATPDAPLIFNGSAASNGSSVRLTNGDTNLASSFFSSSPFDVTGFSTQFQFVTTAGANTAEGLTFTIQGVGNTALGEAGSGLGFGPNQGGGGIDHSVAIKFDLADSDGEGSNSTGLYTDGAAPTSAGSIDLTGAPLDLHSGHTFQVNMIYLGSTLTVTIKDLTTNVAATQTYSNLQIPTIVGGSTAYVGFTAATGGQTSTQDILNWTFQPTAITSPNAPSGLGATPTSATSVSLNWTNNAVNQTSFLLDRATDSGFTQNLITQNLPATPFTFTDTSLGLNPGGTYYYRIRAANSAGSSANSNVAAVTIPVAPPKPTNQVIEKVTDTTISMSWTDNAAHAADGYRILRSVNHGIFTLYATLPLTSRPAPSTYEWTDGDPQNNLTPLTPGNFYEYHIVAYNVSGNNDFAGVNATTRLKAPTLIDVQRIVTSASIFFSTDPQATSYNIYRGNSSGAETLLASGVTGSPYVDNTLSPDGTYFYYVTAFNGNAESVPVPNESAPSNESSPSLGGAAFQWTGNGADNKWSTAANWQSNSVPTGNSNETLVFPSGAAKLSNVDDLPAGANGFAGIVFGAAGYSFTINNSMVVGSGGISITGTGTVTFTGISPSVDLYLSNNAAFSIPSGASLVMNPEINEAGYTLTVSGAGNYTMNAPITGTTGGLTLSTSGTVALNANSSFTGPTNVTGGTVTLNSASAIGANSDVLIAQSATVNLNGQVVFGAGLQGSYYNGAPVAANFASLTALNNFYGPLTPNLTALSGTTSLNNSFDFNTNGSAFPAPYNTGATNLSAIYRGKFDAPVAGAYTFYTASDDGSMLFLDGTTVVNNNFSQGVTERQGSLSLTAGPHDIVIAYYQGGGAYGLNASVAYPGQAKVKIPNALLDAVTTASFQFHSLSGLGTLNLGSNQLTVGNATSAANTSFNTITGSSTSKLIKGGPNTLIVAHPNYTGPTGITGGTLQFGDGVAALSSIPSGPISDQGTLVFANPSNTLSYNNVISGTGGNVTFVGAGTFTLGSSSGNTYTGTTTINDGTVLVTNSSGSATGSGSVVLNGGTLGGTGKISGPVTADTIGTPTTNATVAPGNGPGILSTGSLSLSNDSIFRVELNGTAPGNGANNYDQANVTGSVALNGGSAGAGATLNVALGFNAAISQTFTIVNNDGVDPITGLFRDPLGNTLTEGSTFLAGNGANARMLTISYVGGPNNNDVVLTVANPTIASVTPAFGPASGGTTVVITGTNFTNASAVTFGSIPGTIVSIDSNTQITAITPAVAASTVFVSVTVFGVTTPTNPSAQFTFIGAPTISNVSPNYGPLAGGTSVVITGTSFTGATAVTFGGVNATTFTVNSATQITATAPAGSAGVVDIAVTTPIGASTPAASDQFTYLGAPTLTSVSPTKGPAAGGTLVTIFGTNFSSATAVNFGAASASFTVISATQITATSPAGTGTVHITVSTLGGVTTASLADQFTYLAAPTITSVVPAIGPVAGGTIVVIRGTNFGGTSSVKFGSVNAVSFTVNSTLQITATAPAGIGIGQVDVIVTANGGTTAITANDKFTYGTAPSISSPTATAITGTTATLGGAVTGDGGLPTTRGVVYSQTSINSNPVLGGTGVTNVAGDSGTGTFTANASSLTPGTSYSYAAYATNALGTVYTSVGTFTTQSPPSLLSTVFNGATPELLNLPSPYTDQHSMVRSFRLTFDMPVTLASDAVSVAPIASFGAVPGVITILNSGGTTVASTTWDVTFSGANTHGGSLADGQYNLTVDPSKVTSTTELTLTSAPLPYEFYVLFGEANGDHTVNTTEIIQMRQNANKTSASPNFLWLFDYDWSGSIGTSDIIEIHRNANKTA